jgi:plasmid stability protein
LNLDDSVVREAKQVAAQTGRSLSAVVEDSLRQALARRTSKERRPRVPTFDGDGLQPGVDLDDTAALLDLLGDAGAAR